MGLNLNWPINPSSSGPVQFILDGDVETVSQDTSLPSASMPLPVVNLDANGNVYDLATEAKQDVQITELQDIEAQLVLANTSLDAIEGTDFATSAKQDLQTAELQTLNTVDFATETTLQSVDAELVTLNAVDFATETTLAAADTKLGTIAAVDFATSAKQDLQTTELVALNTVDFATETTLASVLADTSAIAATDFATETTLQSVDAELVTLNAVDFATEATLADVETAVASADASLTDLNARLAGSLVPEEHDYIALTYVGATTDIDTVTYKTGGAAGSTVATLTLGYDGSLRLTSVTRT
jgi:hypothetical protein